MPETIKRQIAYKVRIKDILDSKYIKEDGWQPNYIEVNGNKISRVNLIGVVVLKVDENNVVLDDGSGKIPLRVFENNDFFKKVDIGDVILMIGRPREFGSEKYIIVEILKKIENPVWIDVRKMELSLNKNLAIDSGEEKKANIQEDIIEEIKDDPCERIFNLIKEIDKGEGVDVEEILSRIKDENVEKTIKRLLENGEIFEVKPGKLKVLE
jgi:RPA family protein